MHVPANSRPSFEIFRGAGAPSLEEDGGSQLVGVTEVIAAGLEQTIAAGAYNGAHIDVPYSRPEMSLATLRLKSGSLIPLHTHDCDCLYYVARGSIRMGSETLQAGDGFFVGTDVPYTYEAGPDGAIVLEFRSVNRFSTVMRLKTPAAWDRQVGIVTEAQERWLGEELPQLA